MIIPMLCVTIFLILVVWSLLPTLFPYTTLFRSPPCTGSTTAAAARCARRCATWSAAPRWAGGSRHDGGRPARGHDRSEEHTSELQSRRDLVCRLLLEKKKLMIHTPTAISIFVCL